MLYNAIRDIWEAFKEFTDQALVYAAAATAIYLVISMISYIYRSLKGKRPYSFWYVLLKTGIFAILGIYVSYLVALTLSGRQEGSRVGLINLVPFKTISQLGRFSLEEAENIALFMPLGFIVPFVWKYFRGFFRTTLIGFFTSVLIETTQLLTSRGFFDIDDIMLNTLGAAIGYIIFAGVYDGILGVKRRMISDAAKRCRMKPPLGKLYDRIPLQNGLLLFVLQAFPLIIWGNIIMGFSSDTGEESGGLSKAILRVILKLIGYGGDMSADDMGQSDAFLFYEKILRKSAHMFEYAVLALLAWALIYSIRKLHRSLSYLAGLAAAFIVGMIDETNQMSVAGRTGTYKDVLWDMGGALIAMVITYVVMTIITEEYTRKYR